MNEKNHKIRINKISIEEEISADLVDEVVREFMVWAHDKMYDDEYYPDIKIPFFGRFHVPVEVIVKKIKRWISKYRRGACSREEVVENVSALWTVYRRKVEYRHRSMRLQRFDGRVIRRKKPLYWQKIYIPHLWPELNLPPATKGKYAGLYNSKGEYIGPPIEEGE